MTVIEQKTGASSSTLDELLGARDRHFRELLEALPAAIYTTDAQGHITFYNQAAADLVGHRPVLGKDKWCVTWRLFRTDGSPLPHEECPMAIALKENRAVRGTEIVAERPDGVRVPVIAYPTPFRDASGKLTGAVNMLVEISERKQAEERQALLVRELAHRVNNTVAVILAIMQQNLRGASSVEEFAETFTARIQALGRAHQLLLATEWKGAELGELARAQVVPLVPGSAERFRIGGPLVMLAPTQATALGLVLHELGTNAAKHGALSAEGGSVDITWTTKITSGKANLRLIWTERGGPSIEAPAREGLGSKLITTGLPAARVDWRLDREGLVCTIDMALKDSAE